MELGAHGVRNLEGIDKLGYRLGGDCRVGAGELLEGLVGMRVSLAAEDSLDTAASSVLSYYDELLFDLYGLFAVEDPDMEKIKARMNQYFEQTLALVPGDHTELKNMLNDSVEQAFFDGYDFQAELTAVGSQFDLGQTMVTRAQIVEYMKYVFHNAAL